MLIYPCCISDRPTNQYKLLLFPKGLHLFSLLKSVNQLSHSIITKPVIQFAPTVFQTFHI